MCWSPDGRYVVTGGEDDLMSVWSFDVKRIVVRGEGHKSYVSAVAFDPYTSQSSSALSSSGPRGVPPTLDDVSHRGSRFFGEDDVSYRLGSVGQDGLICLWELSGDSLKIRRYLGRTRSRLSKQASMAHSPPERQELVSPSQPLEQTSQATDPSGTQVTSTQSPPEVNHVGSQPPVEKRTRSASTGSRQEKKSQRRSHSLQAEEPKQQEAGESEQSGVELRKKPSDRASTSSLPPAPASSLSASSNPTSSLPASTSTTSSLPPAQTSSKGKKKHKKDKALKEGKEKSSISSVKSMMKKMKALTGFSSYSASSPRRFVTPFETCYSDDIAPPMNEVNVVEPLVLKKISPERLSDIVFREECVLTACVDGYISVWVRPDHGPSIATMSEPPNPSRSFSSANPPGVS